MIEIIFYIILLSLAAYFLSNVYFVHRLSVPAVSSTNNIRASALPQIKKYAAEFDTPEIWELGSGFGGLALTIAKAVPQARVKGMELSVFPYLISKCKAALSGCENLVFLREDFFKQDMSGADVIVFYLFEEINRKLAPKFAKELKEGTIIIALDFPLPQDSWTALEKISAGKSVGSLGFKENIYIYRK